MRKNPDARKIRTSGFLCVSRARSARRSFRAPAHMEFLPRSAPSAAFWGSGFWARTRWQEAFFRCSHRVHRRPQRATGTSSRRTPCRPKFPPEGAASRALPERSSLRCPSRPGMSPPAHGGPAKPEGSFEKAAFSREAPFCAAIAAAQQGAQCSQHWWGCVRKPGRHCRSLEAAPRRRPMRWRWRGQWRARRGKPW